MIDWFGPIPGQVIAAAEARMSDKPLIPGSHPIARFDAARYYLCLTGDSLTLLQAPNMRVSRLLWMLKKPLDRVARGDIKIDEVYEDSTGQMSARVSWPGRPPAYLTFDSGWRREAKEMLRAVRSGPAPRAELGKP